MRMQITTEIDKLVRLCKVQGFKVKDTKDGYRIEAVPELHGNKGASMIHKTQRMNGRSGLNAVNDLKQIGLLDSEAWKKKVRKEKAERAKAEREERERIEAEERRQQEEKDAKVHRAEEMHARAERQKAAKAEAQAAKAQVTATKVEGDRDPAEYPFQCECGLRFKLNMNLQRHRKSNACPVNNGTYRKGQVPTAEVKPGYSKSTGRPAASQVIRKAVPDDQLTDLAKARKIATRIRAANQVLAESVDKLVDMYEHEKQEKDELKVRMAKLEKKIAGIVDAL